MCRSNPDVGYIFHGLSQYVFLCDLAFLDVIITHLQSQIPIFRNKYPDVFLMCSAFDASLRELNLKKQFSNKITAHLNSHKDTLEVFVYL